MPVTLEPDHTAHLLVTRMPEFHWLLPSPPPHTHLVIFLFDYGWQT
jgi:hypothetical protein